MGSTEWEWELMLETSFFRPAGSLDIWLQLTDLLSSLLLDVFFSELEQLRASSEPDAGLSSFPVASSSDETDNGEGLRDEDEDNGTGEPSDELQFWLEEARAGDWEH